MSEISKAYEPQSVEDKWYDFWLIHGCFTADPKSAKPAYSIVIPPPNVTGVLTMGHVLNNTIQDILARKARMDGKEVLWLPGTDHAGIATQNAVEKSLKKAGEIKHRDDLGREAMVAKIWDWKQKYGGIIIQQLKKLGASCDWSRERFTMDPEYSRCVQRVFVDLYKKGLIYRGKRMVNWCPASLTALSDEEVTMKEQKGFLYYFRVEIAEVPGTFLTIATTRPETIPGDTAVAVNPKDPRYAKYIGKHVIRPLPSEFTREQKLIPIIGDEHVDFEFGTGVLKVTPAHDKADFEIGQRHKLPIIEVIEANGTMGELAGADLRGLDRFKARKVAVEKLTELGALEKEEPYTNNVGYSERADVPIEPRLSEQWFLKYPSVEKSKAIVDTGKMKFHPERWAKVYDHWMGGLQDWCISRQLWWGHRIPVWRSAPLDTGKSEWNREALQLLKRENLPNYESVHIKFIKNGEVKIFKAGTSVKQKDGSSKLLEEDKTLELVDIEVAIAPGNEALERKLESLGFTQDPDVLDTWFSSWLWPFATMGWPEKTEMLKKFYPTNDLVTGPDIIFFWVARMIMAGFEYMEKLPFHNVYFTGIIRDKQGRKMSKSLGNSPDPLDLIAKYGADALRFGVMRAAPLGQDILFDEQNVELGRNFCNKLWNACRFRQMVGSADFPIEGEIDPKLLSSDDKWILLKLDAAIREMHAAFAEYKFSDATATLYRFFWSEYCDWYVEASKAVLGRIESDASHGVQTPPHPNPLPPAPRVGEGTATGRSTTSDEDSMARRANALAVIDFILSNTLRMFHPFLPFITEELWQGMGFSADLPEDRGGKTIMFASWPKPLTAEEKTYFGLDEGAEQVAIAKYEMVSLGRNLRRELKLDPAKKLKFVLKPAGVLPVNEVEVLKLLLNAESMEVATDYQPPKGTPSASNSLGELFLPTTGLIDFAAERARRTKELETTRAEIGKVEAKLANPAFTEKVPAKVLEEHRQRLADWQAKEKQILGALENLPE